MDALLAELRQVYAEAADTDRAWLVGTVVDTSRYTTVGASWVGLLYGDQVYQAKYSDGPRPDEGDELEFKRANRRPDSWYFARPLPQQDTHHGYVYISARDVSGEHGGEWAILRFDAYGFRWTRRSASPVAGTWDRRPIKGIGGFRLFTYGANDDGTGSDAFYSDDGGATWTGTGLTGVLDIQAHSIRLAGAHGSLAAVADNGAKIYVTGDWGASWTEDTRYSDTGQHFYAASFIGQFFYVAALATVGVYVPNGPFPLIGPILPASDDGGAIITSDLSSNVWVQVPGGVMETEYDSITAAGFTDGGDIGGSGFAVPGGPHTAGWLGPVTYLCNDGTGGRAYWPQTFGNTTMYLGTTHHPAGLTAGVRGFVVVAGSGDGVLPDDWPVTTGDDGGFRFAAVDDDDADRPRFLIEIGLAFLAGTTGADPWQVADARQPADLGARYAASMQGCATLEIWDEGVGHD